MGLSVKILIACLGFIIVPVVSAQMRFIELPAVGPQPSVITPQGKVIPIYTESHALLISAGNYLGPAQQGWRKLETTNAEVDRVATSLRSHGFNVWRVTDPNSRELVQVFREFMAKFGHSRDNRLIFYFGGHGYTNPTNNFGYLVPVDAKDPRYASADFFAKALPITQLDIWARELTVRHALFLFDSCFSGSIFTSRSASLQPEPRGTSPSERWRFFADRSKVNVRQFIAAGGADEELPAQSVFVPLLLQALEGRASSYRDGYVTGKEIGLWLEQILPTINRNQNPHSGVIRDPTFAFGDMIFQIPATMSSGDLAPQAPINPLSRPVVESISPSAGPSTPARSLSSCVEVSETVVNNGVATWTKKCI